MNNQNIQRHQCQAIREIFESAEDPRKVMTVGIDPAKSTHKAVVCNGLGDLLCKPLDVRNDREGLAFLTTRVESLCRKSNIERSQVIIGIETPGPWAENFADHLASEWDCVVDLNAYEAKKFRDNPTTDNDKLAAQSICRCVNQKQGRVRPPDDAYLELQMVTRHHEEMTRQQTAVANQIHACCDISFPGLIDPANTGITPLGKGSLDLVESLSIDRVKRMSIKQLTDRLARNDLPHPSKKAAKLKALAQKAIPPSEAKERAMRLSLRQLVAQYRLLKDQLQECEGHMARLLRQTPHCMLTSIDGVGVKLAAQVTAELFARGRFEGAESKVNYVGLTSKRHQTGGDDRPYKYKGKPSRFNRHGKRAVLMAAQSIAQYDQGELREYYDRKKLRGKNAKYSLGRKLIRFAVKLLHGPVAYLPSCMREDDDIAKIGRRHYYGALAEKLERKWAPYRQHKPNKQNDVLAQWTEAIESNYSVGFNL